ncbi:hemin uptake protein HemP [Thiosulfatihalobacter marinus]|jgi:hemin uptake protein HemP|nr:hemin uptake protein HemP [Thiosulfatihalobacter marinus]
MPLSTQINATPLHDATRLTGDNGLAHIRLGDQLYTLRITRAGKLILTK